MSNETSLGKIYKAGEICPYSGQYAVVNEKGVITGQESTMVHGKRFPPPKDGQGYILVDPTRHGAIPKAQDDRGKTLAGVPDGNVLIPKWRNDDTWPTPKWYREERGKQQLESYERYSVHRQRSRYVELESDFRSILSNEPKDRRFVDLYSGERIFDFLRWAKQRLEQKDPDLLEVSHLLDLVERYMPWIMPPQVLVGRRYGVLSRLKNCASEEADLITRITDTLETTAKDYREGVSSLAEARSYLDQAIGIINQHNLEEQISAGLQIRRLKSLRRLGSFMLSILLLTSPLTTATDLVSSELWANSPRVFVAWMVALGIMVIGAAGGFLSGLLQVRESRVTLIQYQESVLKFHLKPIVGAILALILFMLLSWQILPGISIENTGSYVLLAFLAGFSERYFLALLKLRPEGMPSNDSLAESQATVIEEE